jgi:hypothetical protein
MKLVEAESTGPVEGDDALVTPPRPPHRRVSVSLLFTLTVLIGTVVTIYLVFPARHNVLVTEAMAVHRDPMAWDLSAPSAVELRAWMTGVVGAAPPLPGDGAATAVTVIGAARRHILNRAAAVVRVRVGGDEVSYLVQHARGIAPEGSERVEGELRAIAWRAGPYTVVAVGPDASVARWRQAFHK